jgi:hypothetical protein
MYDALVAVLAFGLAALCSLVTICFELCAEHVDSDSADPWRSAPRRGREDLPPAASGADRDAATPGVLAAVQVGAADFAL